MDLKEITNASPVGHKSLRKEYVGLLMKLKRIERKEVSTDIIVRINSWIDFINDSYPIDFECNFIWLKMKSM